MDKNKFSLLNSIKYPEDLRRLSIDQLPQVCKELREDIIDEVAVNPGHFASSLGVVEITVALHYIYNTPYDRIVWDVGHQAYGHKILTGRRENFCTNRKLHGIRPFPTPLESEYDTFACGHASNSISAALGMAVAARENGDTDRHVVAVIGDGAMSGGLAFEGLNNVSSTPNDMLIILNLQPPPFQGIAVAALQRLSQRRPQEGHPAPEQCTEVGTESSAEHLRGNEYPLLRTFRRS